MTIVETCVIVAEDRCMSGVAPKLCPPASTGWPSRTAPKRRRNVWDMPIHHEPWYDGVSPRREDVYSNDGR